MRARWGDKQPSLRPKSIWVRPELSAMIDHTAITREGLLRHASFKRLVRRKGERA